VHGCLHWWFVFEIQYSIFIHLLGFTGSIGMDVGKWGFGLEQMILSKERAPDRSVSARISNFSRNWLQSTMPGEKLSKKGLRPHCKNPTPFCKQ